MNQVNSFFVQLLRDLEAFLSLEEEEEEDDLVAGVDFSSLLLDDDDAEDAAALRPSLAPQATGVVLTALPLPPHLPCGLGLCCSCC